MTNNILLISCSDKPGLIFNITRILYNLGLNIIRNGEFVERKTSHFFMRTVFSGLFQEEILLSELKDCLPENAVVHLSDNRKKKIVVLATREHHCLSDLLLRNAFDELHAGILCVVSNHEVLRPLTEKFEIPFHYLPHEQYSRHDHEAAIRDIISSYDPDYIVLAKYMRILSPEFVARFNNKIINIHHSFLPAFIGANPYAQAYNRGVKIIGATAHFVNDLLDEGPIIAQQVIPVDHTHSAAEMARAGHEVERMVLANALSLVFNEQVFVYGNKTIIFD